MATRPAKQVPLAFVEIGPIDLLMPLDKALQLVALMQHAVTCTQDFTERHERTFRPGTTPGVSVVNVRPDQVIAVMQPVSASRGRQAPLRLTGD